MSLNLTIPDWLNYRHLYYFYAVGRTGSLAAAAKQLRLGSSALSLQIGELEESLGHSLFRREGRGLQLTEMGQITLEYARGIFDLGDELLQATRGRSPDRRLRLHVGVPDSVPKALCSKLVQLARSSKTPSTLSLREGPSEILFRDLLEHRLDLVLSDEKPSPSRFAGLTSRSLGRLPVIVCGAPRFQGLKKAFPNSLHGQPFLMPGSEHPLRADFEGYLRKYQVKVDTIIETQDMSLQKLLGAQGLGLFPVARPAAAHLLREKRLVQLGICEGIHEEFFLVSAPRRIPNPLVEKLLRGFRM